MADVRRLTRSEAETAFDDLARLRIEVFRDFPYLYEGDLDYERQYLSTFMMSLSCSTAFFSVVKCTPPHTSTICQL